MKKDINNIVFTDEILEKYKTDSEKITKLCKKKIRIKKSKKSIKNI